MNALTGGMAAAHEGMGTAISHQAHGGRAQEALEAAKAEAWRLEGLFSRFREDSDVWRINRAAGGEAVSIAPETMAVLRRAAAFSRLTEGCFDATVALLSDAWDHRRAAVPGEDEVARARSLVDYRDLTLYGMRCAASLKRPGQAIDLGGIAKGFAGDRMMDVFRRHGVRSALSNFGGGVSALGARPDGSPWRVGIRHPRGEGLIGAVSVEGGAVVTSGDYERCFFAEGRRYHHLIDPRTGRPAASGLISATVVAPSGLTADALSTALFVAGLEKGLKWIVCAGGAGAVVIDEGMRVFVTRNLAPRFEGAEGFKATVL
jgi:thiamine biosynthesis lipoprotein